MPLLGFIPSPAHGIVQIGPLPLHAYGLMLALGVLAAAKIAELVGPDKATIRARSARSRSRS